MAPAHLALTLSALATTALHLAAAAPSPRAPPPSQQQPQHISIPLKRRANAHAPHQRRDQDAYWRKAQAMKGKYGGSRRTGTTTKSASSSNSKARRQNSIGMTSYQDSEWYGEIDVGTPPTGFSVVLDTGSADLILAEPNCQGCETNTPGYDPTSSSTSATQESSFQITYGSGSGSGELVLDTVSIANYTQPEQIFAACSTLDNIVDGEISGILGLGWTALAASKAVPLVESLAHNGSLPEQVFGFAFETHTFTTASADTAPGGTLTIGGVDTSAYSGEINWINIVEPHTYWAIPLEGMTVGGTDLGITDDSVVIDTGTTLIGMPSSVVESVYSAIPNSQAINLQGESGYYAFPCDQEVEVSLQFGGVQYPVDPDQFNAGAVDTSGRLCLGAVFALETDSDSVSVIVGDAFLTGVYNAYRLSSPAAVGFATLGSGGTANTGSSASSSVSGSGGNGAATLGAKGGAVLAAVGGAVVALFA
ncbi:hypothetical protein JCM6882_002890 [Rhodosporidiobolus microsporus]